jgi:hypothetical protein
MWILAAGPLCSEILFQDDFSGAGTSDLNGTTPDVTIGTTTWTAVTDYAADGSVAAVPRVSAGRAAYLPLGTLINENRGNADAIYTLSATLDVLDTGSATWEAIGFWPQVNPADNMFYENGNAWMLRRGNGDLRVFRGLSTANGIGENGASPNDVTGTVDLRIVLDLTSWDGATNYGTVTYSAKLTADTSYTEIASGPLDAANSSFGAVGFGGGEIAAQLSYFELAKGSTATPDPLQLVITQGSTGFDFEWNSQTGMVYDLVTSLDLSGTPLGWPVYDPDGPGGADPYSDIPSDGLTTVLTSVPADGPSRFFAVVEKDAP